MISGEGWFWHFEWQWPWNSPRKWDHWIKLIVCTLNLATPDPWPTLWCEADSTESPADRPLSPGLASPLLYACVDDGGLYFVQSIALQVLLSMQMDFKPQISEFTWSATVLGYYLWGVHETRVFQDKAVGLWFLGSTVIDQGWWCHMGQQWDLSLLLTRLANDSATIYAIFMELRGSWDKM